MGTTAGFVVGGVIVYLIGSNTTVLWVVLPFALVFTGLFLWLFGKVMRRGFGGSKRYVQLTFGVPPGDLFRCEIFALQGGTGDLVRPPPGPPRAR